MNRLWVCKGNNIGKDTGFKRNNNQHHGKLSSSEQFDNEALCLYEILPGPVFRVIPSTLTEQITPHTVTVLLLTCSHVYG